MNWNTVKREEALWLFAPIYCPGLTDFSAHFVHFFYFWGEDRFLNNCDYLNCFEYIFPASVFAYLPLELPSILRQRFHYTRAHLYYFMRCSLALLELFVTFFLCNNFFRLVDWIMSSFNGDERVYLKMYPTFWSSNKLCFEIFLCK